MVPEGGAMRTLLLALALAVLAPVPPPAIPVPPALEPLATVWTVAVPDALNPWLR
jgi:hypothetical protein